MTPPPSTREQVLFGADVLRRFSTDVLVAAGAAKEAAEICAEVLVAADLGGMDTHGVARLGSYTEALRAGHVVGDVRPEVVAVRGAVTVLDGRNGLGPPCLRIATDLAVDAAHRHGVGVTAVRGSSHVGAIGWYTERAAAMGCVAVVVTSTTPMVAPTHGAVPFLGTNPLAYAMPEIGRAHV